MWSEELDKKIQAAAGETDHHGHDDKAWQKMEVLLDKHLPQEKRRRTVIFFLLLGLLLTIPGYLLLKNSSPGKTGITEQKNTTGQAIHEAEKQPAATIPAAPATTNGTDKPSQEGPVTINATGGKAIAANSPVASSHVSSNNNRLAIQTYKARTGAGKTGTPENTVVKNTKPGLQIPSGTDPAPAPVTPAVPGNEKQPTGLSVTKDTTTAKVATVPTPTPVTTDLATTAEENKPEPKKQTRKKISSKISLNVSLGPDISSVGINNPGRVKMQYGAGLGYALSDRWSIRAGFYAARKLYDADSNSYHLSGYLSNPYYKLQRVDADCFVYEIPVTVVYNFKRSGHHNWFVSTGLSSYIMKQEDYTYTFKTTTGQIQHYDYSYKNENSHYFSVVNLSGGYQYHFTNRLSVLAEPYIKMPVSGVGFGKVRLNSAGVLVTVSLRPFAR